MIRHRFFLIVVLLFMTAAASAQLGKIPVAVTAAFAKQYAAAQQVSYQDNLSDYSVHFLLDSNTMTAHYSSKGVWKGSEKEITLNQLSPEVKDGLAKSKYADWKVVSVSVLYLNEKAGGGEQYRIRVAKGDLNKKQLYFNRTGRLVRDAITL
ncbi:MAG: hypothetical protein JWP27_1823 [Flaviaesturariibacter sp.]|nr:hypothetical protein [Flaviaesturariibacter sp.]